MSQPRSVRRLRERLVPRLLLAACVQIVAGCQARRPPSEGSARVRLVAGIDASASFRPELGAGAAWAARAASRLSPERDWLTISRVEDGCREIYSGPPPKGGEALLRALARDLRKPSPSGGTRVDLFWQAAAREVAACRSACGIALVTDGYADGVDEGGRRRIRLAARELGGNPRVRIVAVVGVVPGTREELRRDLGALGPKLRILRLEDDPGAVIDELLLAPETER